MWPYKHPCCVHSLVSGHVRPFGRPTEHLIFSARNSVKVVHIIGCTPRNKQATEDQLLSMFVVILKCLYTRACCRKLGHGFGQDRKQLWKETLCGF